VELLSVGTAIATRCIRNDKGETAYIVTIGAPRKFEDSDDFYCPVQISSPSEENSKVLYSAGIDSVQSLQLSMKLIGGMLFKLNKQSGGTLRWDGDENGDLGFPNGRGRDDHH
jgi:hypothetical protein